MAKLISYNDLRMCPYQTQEAEKIDSGCDGIVCRISEGLVAKIALDLGDKEFNKNKSSSLVRTPDNFAQEYRFAKFLEIEEFNVANPVGVFKIDFRGSQRPCYVMDFVPGINMRKMNELGFEEDYARVINPFFEEISRARKFGFNPKDSDYYNAIWNPKTDKVTLIDFTRWEIGSYTQFDPNDKRSIILAEKLNSIEVEI